MEQRTEELRLLKEYEAAGKIRRVDYKPPEEVSLSVEEEDEIEERMTSGRVKEGREHLGDGNFRLGYKPKE